VGNGQKGKVTPTREKLIQGSRGTERWLITDRRLDKTREKEKVAKSTPRQEGVIVPHPFKERKTRRKIDRGAEEGEEGEILYRGRVGGWATFRHRVVPAGGEQTNPRRETRSRCFGKLGRVEGGTQVSPAIQAVRLERADCLLP